MMMLLLLTSVMGYELKTAVEPAFYNDLYRPYRFCFALCNRRTARYACPSCFCIVFTLVFARIAAKIAKKTRQARVHQYRHGCYFGGIRRAVLGFSFIK